MQVDLLAVSEQATYQYAGNNPVYFNDPIGLLKNTHEGFLERVAERNETFGSRYEDWSHSIDLVAESVVGPGGGGGTSTGAIYRDENGDLVIDFSKMGAHGGSYSDQDGYRDFDSEDEAFAAGAEYNFRHDSWGNTFYGSYEATFVARYIAKQTGKYLSPAAIKSAMAIVKASRLAQQGGVVLNFTKDYNGAYAGENGWTVLNGTDLASGLAALQAYTASGKMITNLIIHSHGTPDGSQIHLGKTNLDRSYYRWKKLNPTVALMNQVLGEVSPGGTVVFTGCNAANLLGPAMSTNIRCDINVYMNTGLTYGPEGGSSGDSFWFGTERVGGPRPNWMNLQSGASGYVISIGSGGITVR
jgi:hypothetical protein